MDERPGGPGEIPADEDLPEERPDDDGAPADEELRDEEGFLAPGVPPWYEGSPGAALATESEEDIPEPNEPG